jgi:hypothetical protein
MKENAQEAMRRALLEAGISKNDLSKIGLTPAADGLPDLVTVPAKLLAKLFFLKQITDAGLHGRSVTLTPAQCAVLAEAFKDKRKGRPPKLANFPRDTKMACDCLDLEKKGIPIKDAIKQVARRYRVGRSTAHAARKRMLDGLGETFVGFISIRSK